MYNKNGKHSLSIPRSLSPTRWAGKDFRLFDPKWYDTATASFMRDNSDPSVQALQRLAMKMYPTGRAPVSELCEYDTLPLEKIQEAQANARKMFKRNLKLWTIATNDITYYKSDDEDERELLSQIETIKKENREIATAYRLRDYLDSHVPKWMATATLEEVRNGHELRSANDVAKLNILEKKEILQRLQNLEWSKSEQFPIKNTRTIKTGGNDIELSLRLCEYLKFRCTTDINQYGEKCIVEDFIDIASIETDANNAGINVKAEAKSDDLSGGVISNKRPQDESKKLTYKYKNRKSFDTREEAEAYKKFQEELFNEEKEELKFFCGLAEFDTEEKAVAWKKHWKPPTK